MNKIKNFWQNKTVLITGINGFIGSNLAKYLLKNNAKIYGLIRKVDKNTLLFYEKLDKKIQLFYGDITDIQLIKRIINEENIKHIFHLAAQVEVGIAMKYPFSTFESNIKGTYSETCPGVPKHEIKYNTQCIRRFGVIKICLSCC